SAELVGVQTVSDLIEQVNKRFPAPMAPRGVTGSGVVRLSDEGVFTLADGDRVYMDGVSCFAEGLEALRRVVLDKDVVVVVSRRSSGPPAAADLGSAKTMSGFIEPAYSAIAETAITSGWCRPVSSPTNPHNQRYAALAEAFSRPAAR